MKILYKILSFIFLFSDFAYSQVNGGNITWPPNRAVFQRNTSNQANVPISGNILVDTGYSVQYKLESLYKDGTYKSTITNWTTLSSTPSNFLINKTLSTGWYKFSLRWMSGGSQYGSDVKSLFGVGEVLVIAGQSNALGEGSVNYSDASNIGADLDCISISNQTYANKCSGKLPVFPTITKLYKNSSYIGPNGIEPWAYNMLGTKIVDSETNTVVPVMFFNTAMSGSSSEDWALTAQSTTTNRSNNNGFNRCSQAGGRNFGQGEPYRSLRNSLNYYGSFFGVRAVLWHQGEADNINNVTQAIYKTNLNTVIDSTRSHFNNNLAWAISKVSWDGSTTDVNITNGQDDSRTAKSAANGSINSDTFTSISYRQDAEDYNLKVHFNMAGLKELATNSTGSYYANWSNIKAKIPVVANKLIPITLSGSGGSKTATLNFGAVSLNATDFNCFHWTNEGTYDAISYPSYTCNNEGAGTSKLITQSGIWRCFMRDSKGNVYVSQSVQRDNWGTFRVAKSPISSKAYPNPNYSDFANTIAFTLEKEAHVKVEILDHDGSLIQILTDGEHDAGEFEYPYKNSKKMSNRHNILFYRITINGEILTKRLVYKSTN